ncbi:unnamed protein product [Heterobilharzia americana]|nr:unnamed protein product [Heterobilharzia americana]
MAKISTGELKVDTSYLLQYAWEKLHTGHWKDVNVCWRILYAAIKVLFVLYSLRKSIDESQSEYYYCYTQFTEMICELDYSLIMGYPVFDSFASKLASELHKCIKFGSKTPIQSKGKQSYISFQLDDDVEPLTPSVTHLCELDRVNCPSLEEFSNLMNTGQPFIITNAINFWPAYHQLNTEHNWTLNYWKENFGHRLVPVEIGSKYTEENWGQKLMTINNFIDKYFALNNVEVKDMIKGYLAQYEIFLQIPELENDIHIPDYCTLNTAGGSVFCENDDNVNADNAEIHVDTNIWFGPKGTVSPLHHDSDRANLLTQVKGFKYVILYPASQSAYLYAHTENMLSNTSRVDVEKPDFNKYPEFVNAHGFYGILSPGEMLYIPPRCWHHVRSLSASFSVNFWWDVVPSLIPPWQ